MLKQKKQSTSSINHARTWGVLMLHFDDSWNLQPESNQTLKNSDLEWSAALKNFIVADFKASSEFLERNGHLQKWLSENDSQKFLLNLTTVESNNEGWTLIVNEVNHKQLFNEFTEQIYSDSKILDKKEWNSNAVDDISAQSLLQMQAIINMASEAILLFDFDKKQCITSNKRAQKLFGLSEEEIIQKSLGDLSPKWQADGRNALQVIEDHLAKAANGHEVSLECSVYRSDGKLIPVEIRSVRIPFSENVVLSFSIIDISERKQYESRIKSTESLYRQLFESHRTALVYEDGFTQKLSVNQAFRSLFNLSTENVEVEDFTQWIHPDDLSAYRAEDESLKKSESDRYELKIRCMNKAGRVFFTRLSVCAIRNDQGEVIASLRMIEDETSEREMDRELREVRMRNEELIKTNSELDGFVYTVSHDIRAPLSSLKGLIALLKEEEDADTISHYIQLQEESVVRLDTFIKEISEYSRNRKSKLKKEVVNIDQLVQEVIEQHRYMPDYHRQVNLRMESEGVHHITSDRSRINLILNNLISNGIKYADLNKKRSYVAIRIKEGDAQELIIEVEDNGIGIKNEYQSRIFDMFYRINSKIEGTGIGLHIVKEAMERIGAKIEVQSVEGEGTTFRLILPSLNK